jgi:flagellar basal-body rod protein FlgB
VSGAPLSVALGAKALDGLAMRMSAIAQNLANANSVRFQPVEVRFEEALRQAATAGVDRVEALRFAFTAGRAYAAGEDRRLDLMIADAAQTAMRYSALVDLVGRRLALRGDAIGAGT